MASDRKRQSYPTLSRRKAINSIKRRSERKTKIKRIRIINTGRRIKTKRKRSRRKENTNI